MTIAMEGSQQPIQGLRLSFSQHSKLHAARAADTHWEEKWEHTQVLKELSDAVSV